MSVERARSGDLLESVPDPAGRGLSGAVALVRDERLEVMRWVLPAGRAVPEHLAYGPATIQCIQGDVLLLLERGERRMHAGAIVYLAGGERHALRALADSVLLVTMVLVPPSEAACSMSPEGAVPPTHGERADGRRLGK